MPKGNKLFSFPQDLLIPILPSTLFISLGLWSTFKGETTPAIVISSLLTLFGAAFLVLFYLVRYHLIRHDFITKHGILIRWGDKNRPPRDLIEGWTDKFIDFWVNTRIPISPQNPENRVSLSKHEVESSIKGALIIFMDTEKIKVGGIIVRGLCTGDKLYIGYSDKTNYVFSLFRHELAHNVLGFNGWGWGGDLHHKILAIIHHD